MKNYYTLEYSPLQKCFHYDDVIAMTNHNLDSCLNNTPEDQPGYICLGIFETDEEREKAKNAIEELFLRKQFEKKMGAGTETEKDYLADYLENKKIPPEYLDYCRDWERLYFRWEKLKA